MIQKLFSLVAGTSSPDNPDSPQNQEVMLGGHFFVNALKEMMSDYLVAIEKTILQEVRKPSNKFSSFTSIFLS